MKRNILELCVLLLCILSCSHQLNILFVSPCLSGHLVPSNGIVAALVKRGHTVDLFLTDNCCTESTAVSLFTQTKCFYKPVLPNLKLNPEDQADSLKKLGKFARNATYTVFHVVNDHLTTVPKDFYDVIVHDFLLLGLPFLGEIHNIPVVTSVIGSMILSIESEPREAVTMIYKPESFYPSFVFDFLDRSLIILWQYFFSTTLYESLSLVYSEYNCSDILEQKPIVMSLPYSYYYFHSVTVLSGPPQYTTPTLSNYSGLISKGNVHYYGFVPNEVYYEQVLNDHIVNFVETAESPVVYMSLGTITDRSPEEIRSCLLQLCSQTDYAIVFSLPYSAYVVYKDVVETNKNFLLTTKVAQFNLLMRSEVKVFITHAGANGMQESVFALKPMLVYPGFGDQNTHAKKLVNDGVALPLKDLSYEEIYRKLGMIMDQDVYESAVRKLLRSRDFMTSLGGYDKAAEIVEKVQRGDIKVIDPPPIRNDAMSLFWDISIYLSIILIVLLLVFFFLLRLGLALHRKMKSD